MPYPKTVKTCTCPAPVFALGLCQSCYMDQYGKRYRAERLRENPDYDKERNAKNRAARKKYYEAHREEQKARGAELKRQLKLEVMQHYGGACQCCGETRIEFLTIDHVNGDGAEHRRVMKGGMYYWLRRNGYPQDGRFRALCMNCNWSRGNLGYCPHERE